MLISLLIQTHPDQAPPLGSLVFESVLSYVYELELELLNAVWGAAHKIASLMRGPVRGHHGVSLGGGLSR